MRSFTASISCALVCAFVAACATRLPRPESVPQQEGTDLQVRYSTPVEFCSGTGRSIAVGRYDMRIEGTPLEVALQQNEGVGLIDAITTAVYSASVNSEDQAADAGTAACLSYFG